MQEITTEDNHQPSEQPENLEEKDKGKLNEEQQKNDDVVKLNDERVMKK